jgi:hypothetical protein
MPNTNTAERGHVGSDITQKQNKYEQAGPEITYGTDEDTYKLQVSSRAQRAISLSAWACGGDGTWQDGNVGNEKCGVASGRNEKKRGQEDIEVAWWMKGGTFYFTTPSNKQPQWPFGDVGV